jgi:deoxycytidine triphosphate deaminase
MILSNIEVFRALDEGRLLIRPQPAPRLPTVGQAHSPYDTHSVDLSLGNEITVPKKGQITYDLTRPGSIAETIRQHSDTVTITELQPFCLEPNCFVLGKTLEHIELPIVRASRRTLRVVEEMPSAPMSTARNETRPRSPSEATVTWTET